MGVNVNIGLPNNARLRDVANAIGVLAGIKPLESRIDTCPKGFFIDVPGVSLRPCGLGLESCSYIDIRVPNGKKMVDGETEHTWLMFHFEMEMPSLVNSDIRDYARGMLPIATPFWIAIGRRLVQFFGGWFIPNDCNDEVEIYAAPHYLNGAVSGDVWDQQQRRIFELQPITAEELRDAVKVATYK